MKRIILGLPVGAFSLFSALALASGPSVVQCQSFMSMGFFGGNESGVFTYTRTPFKISVAVDGKEQIISDTDHHCLLKVDQSNGNSTLLVSQESSNTSGDMNLLFKLKQSLIKLPDSEEHNRVQLGFSLDQPRTIRLPGPE